MGHQVFFNPGDRVGNLEIERQLGRGAFGVVYLARDTQLARRVALKVCFGPGGQVDPAARERILAEARLVSSIRSPNVITLFSLRPLGEHELMVEMEYAEGGTLATILAERGALPPEEGMEILRGIALGLKAAHAAGIVHGDVKPANVLMDAEGTAKLADFGLSRLIQDPGLASSLDAGPVGTPRYMAPEVVMGHRPGPAADVWGFGIILFRILTGRLPFEGGNIPTLFFSIQNAPTPPLDPNAPAGLARLTQRCLAKSPEARPGDFDEILRQLESVATPTLAAPAVEPLVRLTAPPLFGRRDHVARFDSLLDRVRKGHGSAVLVTGEAGIGKTTLMRNVAARAAKKGFAWIETEITPLKGLLRPLLEQLQLHTSGRAEPVLIESRQQLVWMVERLLESTAGDAPLGLLVEDAHHADAEDLQLLAGLAARIEPMRVLLTVNYRLHDERDLSRSDEGTATHHRLTSRWEFDRIDLGGLEPESIVRVIDDAAEDLRVAPEVATRVTQAAQGNPLFARELLLHLREQGAVVREGDSLLPGPEWEDRTPPRRIRDLVTNRLEGLDEDCRAALDAAAVDGLAFDGDAVAAVLELPLLKVLRLLQNLFRDRAIVVPRPAGYQFAHPLIQEVIYDETAPALRTAVHRRIAEHLEQRGKDAGVDPERIGTHWERGGELERAVPYLLQAAVAAERRQEILRTIDLCERAGWKATRIDPDTAVEYRRAVVSYAICLSDIGRHEEADAAYRALIAGAEKAGDETLRLRVITKRFKTLFPARGLEVVDEGELKKAASQLPRSQDLGLAQYNLGIVSRVRGNLAEARKWLEAAAETHRELDHSAGLSDALDQLATLSALAGNLEEAEALYGEAARLSRRVGRRTNAALSEINRALRAFQRGAFEGLEESLERSIAVLELEGTAGAAAHASLILAHLLYALGDVTAARSKTQSARTALEQGGSLAGLNAAYVALAQWATVRGHLEKAEEMVAAARAAAEKAAHVNGKIYAAAVALQAYTFAGRIDEARREALAALELAATAGEMVCAELVVKIGEAVLHGLPVSVLDAAPDLASTRVFLAGVRAFVDPDGPPEPLEAAAEELLGPGVGERRAERRIVGRWLGAAALRRRGECEQSKQEADAALSASRSLGHVWYETTLEDWSR